MLSRHDRGVCVTQFGSLWHKQTKGGIGSGETTQSEGASKLLSNVTVA